jgi:hypothetical protein
MVVNTSTFLLRLSYARGVSRLSCRSAATSHDLSVFFNALRVLQVQVRVLRHLSGLSLSYIYSQTKLW